MNSTEFLHILFWPLIACISMGLLHGYAGLHVLRRGVIFVDLALAQMAALGAVVGMFVAPPFHSATVKPAVVAKAPSGDAAEDDLSAALMETGQVVHVEHDAEESHGTGFLDFWPTVFALGGAVLLAFGRAPENRVPHEAIIGVVYVVAAAVTVLLLSKAAHGHEEMEQMLTGKLLFVDQTEVITTAVLYAGLGLLHWIFRRQFIAISDSAEAAAASGLRVKLWDCLFYAMFALMVTRSVVVGGVLVVFSFLIIPGACAAMWTSSWKGRVIGAWLVATLVSMCGVVLSAAGDLPTGATMVATFGAALVISTFIGSRLIRARRNRQPAPIEVAE